MAIWTTYLGFLNKHGGANKVAMKLGSCFVYYVARNRGNNQVAPEEKMLEAFMKLKKTYKEPKEQEELWKQYEENYLIQIGLDKQALAWMEKRAQEAKIGNILLVCYCGPRFGNHCHRFLLAQEISRRFDVEYIGELTRCCCLTTIKDGLQKRGAYPESKRLRKMSDDISKQLSKILS